jgi:hypothetical protein
MLIPLPTVFLATFIEKAPKRDTYEAEIYYFSIGKVKIGFWLKYK